MYAGDLVMFFLFDYHDCPRKVVMKVLQESGEYSGLRLNLKKKTAAVVRNSQVEPWLDAFKAYGISVRNWLCYLGIRLGNVLIASTRHPL